VPREEQPHEWISFDDRTEKRTWMIDATFMRSSWKCIFGEGCQGVYDHPTPELNQGCCSHGAHFVDEADVANVVKHVVRLTDEQWQSIRAELFEKLTPEQKNQKDKE
jgi:hypothetical protein